MNWEDELENFPLEREDPDYDRTCPHCKSKYCEGECVLLEQDSTEYPDTDGAYGGGIARNN